MFRHPFASRLVEGNLPINNVSDLLGHSQISTTLDVYTHRFKENNLEKLERPKRKISSKILGKSLPCTGELFVHTAQITKEPIDLK
jgi:hypothetical protein